MVNDDLVRLIREIIKQEMSKHSRLGVNELTSKTGDLNLTAMGNIFIDPATGKKAYYNGTEILTGVGGGAGNHAALSNLAYATSGHTGFAATGDLANYLKLSGGQNLMLQSLGMNGNEIYGMNYTQDWNTQTDDEGVAKGNITGASGFMSKAQTPGNNWYFQYGLRLPQGTDAAKTATPTEGQAYWATDTDKFYIGKGSNLWKEIGALTGIAWGEITGTLSNQTDLQNALNAKLSNPSSTDLTLKVVDAGIHLYNAAGSVLYGDIVTNQTSGAFYLSSIQGSLILQANNATKLTIANSLITSAVPLKISTDAVPLTIVEADRTSFNNAYWREVLDNGNLRFDLNTSNAKDFATYQSPFGMSTVGDVHLGGFTGQGGSAGTTLLIGANASAITAYANPVIQKLDPKIEFRNAAAGLLGGLHCETSDGKTVLGSEAGDIYIQGGAAGKSIFLRTNYTTRLTISDTAINVNSTPVTNAPSIQAPAASSLTLKVSSGQSIIFQAV